MFTSCIKKRYSSRYGTIHPIFDDRGSSSISVEDLAAAVVDETKEKKFNQTIFTVGY